MILKNKTALAFISFVILAASLPAYASPSCSNLFEQKAQAKQKNLKYMDFVHLARDRAANKGHQPPEFIRLERASRGMDVQADPIARALEKALPKGASKIDQELFKSSQAGWVKTTSQSFVSLRAEVDFEGQKIATNVGVSTEALYDNLSRTTQTFVPKKAEAVLVFMHGGGTSTTGHHVAANLSATLRNENIAVVSFDQLWHAMGPRVPFRDTRHYFDFVRAFITQYIKPSGVPVILGGHSMGGIFSDIYMRLYNDGLVNGVISMSGVVDPAPGKSMVEKLKAELIDESRDGEVDELLLQGKISPFYELMIGDFGPQNDWSVPAHRGKQYLPALYLWGTADSLYRGKEQLIADNLIPLENVTLKLYDNRVTTMSLKAAEAKLKKLKEAGVENPEVLPDAPEVGHLIFDSFPANVRTIEQARAAKLEAYQDIAQWIKTKFLKNSSSGEPAADKSKKVGQTAEASREQMLQAIIGTYFNSPAFRQFLDHAEIPVRDTPEEMREVRNAVYKAKALRAGKVQAELDNLMAGIEKATGTRDLDELLAHLSLSWAPKGPEGDQAREWIRTRDQLEKESSELNKANRINEQLVEKKKSEARKAHASLEELLAPYRGDNRAELDIQSRALEMAFTKKTETANQLYESQHAYSDAIAEFRLQAYQQGMRSIVGLKTPQHILDKIALYEQRLADYEASRLEFDETLVREAESGGLGSEIRNRAEKANAAQKEFEMERARYEELENRKQEIIHRSLEIESNLSALDGGKYVEIRRMRGSDLFSLPQDQFMENYPQLQKLWASWKVVASDKPEAEDGSLY